jgi:hypothetical protein
VCWLVIVLDDYDGRWIVLARRRKVRSREQNTPVTETAEFAKTIREGETPPW